jgi:polysaccharide biosynthesis transport protein
MKASQITKILKARWGIVVGVMTVTALLVGGTSALMPKKYSASAELLIDSKSPDPINGMVMAGGLLPSHIATQIDIIKSERVARKVISSLRLRESSQLREQWISATNSVGDFDSWLSKLLTQELIVQPSRESAVIEIIYTGSDPSFAAVVANAYAQSYVDTTLELRVEPAKRYAKLFDAQVQEAKKRLEDAQSRLSDLQKSAGITATDERLDVETARLNELNTQYTILQAQLAESISRKAAAGPNLSEVLNNPLISSMKSELARQEARMKEIASRFGVAHPQYLETQASVNELHTRIDQETNRVTSSLGLNTTANTDRLAQVRRELEAQKLRVLERRDKRDVAAVMLKEVANAQQAYDTIVQRFTQTSLESQSAQANVSVLKSAYPSPETAVPRVGINTILGTVFGLLLGISLALVRELMDRKIRDEDDFSVGMGLPSLGTMPVHSAAAKISPVLRRADTRALVQARRLPELAAPSKAPEKG